MVKYSSICDALENFVSSLEDKSVLDLIVRGAISHRKDMQSIFEEIAVEDLNYTTASKIAELKLNSDFFLDYIRDVVLIKEIECLKPKAKEQSS